MRVTCLSHTPAEQYCICEQLLDNQKMVGCDYCDNWYHSKCIEYSLPKQAFFCEGCRVFRQFLNNWSSDSQAGVIYDWFDYNQGRLGVLELVSY